MGKKTRGVQHDLYLFDASIFPVPAMHTVERCRKEFWAPAVCDRAGLDTWLAGGRQDAVARARQRWQELVVEHEDPPLDETTARQLQAYVDEHLA